MDDDAQRHAAQGGRVLDVDRVSGLQADPIGHDIDVGLGVVLVARCGDVLALLGDCMGQGIDRGDACLVREELFRVVIAAPCDVINPSWELFLSSAAVTRVVRLLCAEASALLATVAFRSMIDCP